MWGWRGGATQHAGMRRRHLLEFPAGESAFSARKRRKISAIHPRADGRGPYRARGWRPATVQHPPGGQLGLARRLGGLALRGVLLLQRKDGGAGVAGAHGWRQRRMDERVGCWGGQPVCRGVAGVAKWQQKVGRPRQPELCNNAKRKIASGDGGRGLKCRRVGHVGFLDACCKRARERAGLASKEDRPACQRQGGTPARRRPGLLPQPSRQRGHAQGRRCRQRGPARPTAAGGRQQQACQSCMPGGRSTGGSSLHAALVCVLARWLPDKVAWECVKHLG